MGAADIEHQPDLAGINRFDLANEVLLVALLVFAPLSFGAVEAWSRLVVFALVAVMCLVLTSKLIVRHRSARFVWSWAYLPIVLFIALAIFQSIPLPAGLVTKLSPRTVSLKSELLSDAIDADQVLARPTLSFYSYATRQDLRIVLAAAAVFVVVINTYRRSSQIRRLLAVIAGIGAAVALLALAQDFSGAGSIYWIVPMPLNGQANGGPFVNHSHFAQFMNLSLGAAIGLLLVELQAASQRSSNLADLFAMRDGINRRIVLLAITIVAGALSIVMSSSRGGIIGLLAATAVMTALLLLTRRRSRKDRHDGAGSEGWLWAMAVVALVCFACIVYFGFDRIYLRFATHQDIEQYGGRGEILRDMAGLWRMFPLLGTGLGTHEMVFPLVDKTIMGQVAVFAENDWAQLMEEMGAIGLLLVVSYLAIIVANFIASLRRRRAIHWSVFGLGFALVAVMVSSLSDFGQHMPGIAVLTATICGLLVALPRLPLGQRETTATAPSTPRASSHVARWIGMAAALALTAGIGAILPGANATRLAAAHWHEASQTAAALAHVDWIADNDRFDDLISQVWLASDLEPGNVKYRYFLNEYRWHAISRMRNEESGRIELSPEMLTYTRGVVQELHEARLLCPTYGSPLALAGQLELSVLNDPSGADHIREGYRLSPQDPVTCFIAGELEVHDQNWDASLTALRRALVLDPRLFHDALDLYLNGDTPRADLAFQLADNRADSLLQLADTLDQRKIAPDIAAAARGTAIAVLEKACESPTAGAEELASLAGLCRVRGDDDRAIAYYRRALAVNFDQADWHLDLAKLLAKHGDPAAAEREAKACLSLRPHDPQAGQIIASTPLDPATQPAATPASQP